MFIGKNMTIPMLWGFAKKNLFQTLLLSTAAVFIYHIACMKFVAIPFLPIASIGTAVAFYVGFKNNQAYDRLWEARRLWGGITNTSRAMTALFLSLIDDKGLQKEFIYKHIAYINMLRIQLRKTIEWATSKENIHQASITEAEEIKSFDKAMLELFQRFGKADLYEKMMKLSNPASHVLTYQMAVLTRLKREKKIDEYEHSDLCKHINELYNLQGGCERIKTTPLFRQYSIFSRIFVGLFNTLLPFGMLSVMKDLETYGAWTIWLTIPFTLLVSWVFQTMEQIGEYSENPFDNGINDIPISSICRNIEIDLLEMIGETNLPERVQPYKEILL